ncbi:MAG: peroxiredoxin [Thermotogae bacterium]|nr:peroxiredoxin [Thermotogota bacterium]
MPNVGDLAPDFTLKDESGRDVSLSALKGRWVVLYFYPKDDTPGCTTEAKGFTALADEFARLGAAVVGVSPDPPQRHAKFKRKHGLKVVLLSDPEARVLRAYGAWGKRRVRGKEREGVIRSTYLIDPEGRVAHVWPKVRPKGHAEEVLEVLKALVEGRNP